MGLFIAMNGGDGPHSYVQNSSYQRGVLDVVNPIIDEEISKNFDFKDLSSALCVADFGCSTGHNSFPVMKVIIDAMKRKHESREYCVLFNDVVLNDFNTLFSSLPAHRDYHAVGLPGDLHTRLLPSSSLHFAYSSWSLHWLTEVPKAVVTPDSPAWNKGRIFYSGDRKEVCDAYKQQFEKDVEAFLEARGAEIVEGGLMVLLIPGVPSSWNPETEYTIPSHVNLLGSCLLDLAQKGRISEGEIDSFNFPYYLTTPLELKTILQKSKTFSIRRMETVNNPGKYAVGTAKACAALYRSVHEGWLSHHFGPEIIDELFDLFQKKLAASPVPVNPTNDRSLVILVVLKHQIN